MSDFYKSAAGRVIRNAIVADAALRRWLGRGATVAGLLAAVLPLSATAGQELHVVAESPLVRVSDYQSTRSLTLSNGDIVEQTIIHGPPKPPPGFIVSQSTADVGLVDIAVQQATALSVPAYTWVYGCSAVSGSMIAAYYDRNGYPGIYTGPANGGVMPMNDNIWPTWTDSSGALYPNNPLIASHVGVDGRLVRGSIDDYWVKYDSVASDPYITNGWAQHGWGDAIGDYMLTSQSARGNTDGSTTFYNYSSSSKLTCASMASGGYPDGTLGRKNFYEARGYTVTDCYNQYTDNKVTGGFSFAQYRAEIDAGHPVMLNLVGHTVVGVGYDAATSTVYLHDTWTTTVQSMTWGTSYSGMALQSVSIVHLAPTSGGYSLNVSSSGVTGVAISANAPNYAGTTSYVASGIVAGTGVTLTAPASAGVGSFASWTGCDSASGNSCSLTINANRAVIANYSVPATLLSNGASMLLSGTKDSEKLYYVNVPAGAASLSVSIAGGTGDADLYVRRGALPNRSSSDYDCAPLTFSNNESCSFDSPAAGAWYIDVFGYNAYSGVTLLVSYTAPPGAPTVNSVFSGRAQLTVAFTSPTDTGGASITSYTASCAATGRTTQSTTGTASPLAVRGLVPGVPYNCSVTATNGAGLTGPASAAMVGTATPSNIVPVLMLLN
jgi:hypothetical protein